MPRPVEDALKEKVYAAEAGISIGRAAVIGFNSLVYLLLLRDQPHTIPWLAYTIIATANPYGFYVHFAQPYRRWPIMRSSYFTTTTDAVLILLWILATGSIYSPFYVLWYAALTSVAFRYGYRQTVTAAVVYALSYVALILLRGEIAGFETEMIVRVGYIFLVAGLGAPFARVAYEEIRARQQCNLMGKKLAGVAAQLRASEERARKIFEESPIGICTVDLHGRFSRVNKAF
ncbi:MAG: PAS domain S-box protein, partial [Deltaproteobacteria bacterium]|nr:PAS domain S-box protein [Deltaproteobacteria bacterium]